MVCRGRPQQGLLSLLGQPRKFPSWPEVASGIWAQDGLEIEPEGMTVGAGHRGLSDTSGVHPASQVLDESLPVLTAVMRATAALSPLVLQNQTVSESWLCTYWLCDLG